MDRRYHSVQLFCNYSDEVGIHYLVLVSDSFLALLAESMVYNRSKVVCLCVCVLTRVAQIITAACILVIQHGDLDTHAPQTISRTFRL